MVYLTLPLFYLQRDKADTLSTRRLVAYLLLWVRFLAEQPRHDYELLYHVMTRAEVKNTPTPKGVSNFKI